MASENNTTAGGIGFFGLLGILFIGLRLTNVIDWPWWVVLAPIWGPMVLAILVFMLIWLIAMLASMR